eukprot:gene6211-10217_t
MGISLILKTIEQQDINEVVQDPKKLGEILKYPYVDYIDYYKSEEAQQDKKNQYDADSSWDPLNYLFKPEFDGKLKKDVEFKLCVGLKKYYVLQLSKNNIVKITYGKGTFKNIGIYGSKTESNYFSSLAESLEYVTKKLKEKLKEYQLVLEFTPQLTEEDLQKDEEEENTDDKPGEKRKRATKPKSSKKIKILQTLQGASIDFMKLELEKRGLETNGTKADLTIRLAFEILGLHIKPPTEKLKKCFFLDGGKSVDFPMAYGNPRILRLPLVKEWLDTMNSFSEEDLKKKYDPKKMEQEAIGPPNFYNNVDETWKYLLLHIRGVKSFLSETVNEKKGLIVYLS